jgi:hypothetical protein
MSALIAVPPSPQSPAGSVVSAGDWWPSIDCNALRDSLRLGEVVTHARLLGAVQAGLVTVTGELAAWRAVQEEAGFASLALVAPADVLRIETGEADEDPVVATRLDLLFIRAVSMAAGAELAELHRDVTATQAGEARAEEQLMTAADYRRFCTWAIRDILGTTRTSVELI